MGTRAVYTIRTEDNSESFSVYSHWDNNPTGAAEFLTKALTLAWQLPRFEPDEFAASLIAANKSGSGNWRITTGPDAHGDLSYEYEVWQAPNGQMIIKDSDGFYGRLKDFVGKHGDERTRRLWNELVYSSNPLSED